MNRGTLTRQKKDELLDKLKRIKGRVEGLSRMIEDDRASEDILMQISATHEALRVAAKSMIQQYLETSISTGLMATNTTRKEEAYDELIDLLYKYVK